MKGLGFALGTLAGMALSTANARERRACELNELGIRFANEYHYQDALDCFLEADQLMPGNYTIQNNIRLCIREVNKINDYIERDIDFKICPSCNHQLNEVAKKCPYCDYDFEENDFSDFEFDIESITTKSVKNNGLSFECPDYYDIGNFKSRDEVYKSIVVLSKNDGECELFVMEYKLSTFDIKAKKNVSLLRKYLNLQGYEMIVQNKSFPYCFDAIMNTEMGEIKTTILYNFETYKVFMIVANMLPYSNYNCLNDLKIIYDTISSI